MGVDQNIRQSGSGLVFPDGAPVIILGKGKGLPEDEAEGVGGCALVQVDVSDFPTSGVGTSQTYFGKQTVAAPAAITDYQQRVILKLGWQVGISQHSALVDVSQSTTFTVAACDAIDISAMIWALDTELAPIAAVRGFAQQVSINVNWKSGASPVHCYMTGRKQSVGGEVPPTAVFQRIPKYAQSGMCQVTDPTLAPTLIADFSTSDIAAGPVLQHRVVNPYLNGYSVTSMSRFIELTSASLVAFSVTPIWRLFL